MDSIFFEKQEGMLCAQHALNMLLQQPLFSAVELADIAHELDRKENGVLGRDSQMAKSENMDDSGFFSVQVISKALEPFSLDLVHIDHPSVVQFKNDPTTAVGFICNQQQHWFALRKLGSQWFGLNSIKKGPQLLSDTYLSIYLHQLRTEGYTIFFVNGVFPESEADRVISLCPVKPTINRPTEKKKEKTEMFTGQGQVLGSKSDSSPEQDDIAAAIAMSLGNPADDTPAGADPELAAAMEASLRDGGGAKRDTIPSTATIVTVPNHVDEVRNRREQFLSRLQ